MKHTSYKKKKIIIYGFGHWGKEYWRQMQLEPDVEVLFFIDKRYEEYRSFRYPIYSIDILKEDVDFDFILISLENPSLSKQVTEELERYGIDKAKIIYPDGNAWNRKSVCKEGLLKSVLQNEIELHEVLVEYQRCGLGRRRFFDSFIADIKKNNDKDNIASFFLERLQEDELSDIDKITFIVLLYDAGILTSELLRGFVKALDTLTEEKRDDLYVFLAEMQGWTHRHSDAMYPDLLSERKRLMKKVCDFYHLRSNGSVEKKRKKNVQRVIMMVYQLRLSKQMIGIDGIACQLANQLVRQGLDVGIVLTSTYENWDVSPCITPIYYDSVMSAEYEWDNRTFLDKRISVFYRYETTIAERLQGSIDDIDQYEPDVILDLADSKWMPAAILSDHYPILRYPMRNYALDTYFHKTIIYGNESDYEWAKEEGLVKDEQLIRLQGYGFGCEYFTEASDEGGTREHFGLKEDDFLIVTVGARLQEEVRDDIGSEMKALLEKYNNIKWLLVGEAPGLTGDTYDRLKEDGKICYWGYEQKMNELLKCCDVYLNPKREGGGLSIKMAMALAKPVAMLDNPSDGSEILGETNLVEGDYPELVQYVEQLYCDKELYKKAGQAMKDRIAQLYSPDSIKEVIRALEETREALI